MKNKLLIYTEDLAVKKSKLGLKNKVILSIYQFKILTPIRKICEIFLGLELPTDAYAKRIRLGHPFSIVINKKVTIGQNLTVYHNTTIGSKQFGNKSGVPTIEENVIIYPHSCILGKITIGKNSIIGAGSIVTMDVAANTIVAGNPAKVVGIIQTKEDT